MLSIHFSSWSGAGEDRIIPVTSKGTTIVMKDQMKMVQISQKKAELALARPVAVVPAYEAIDVLTLRPVSIGGGKCATD